MPKANECKIEFYFSREQIEKLLKEHPRAKGIIVSQEIKVRYTSDKTKVNVIEIKARADNSQLKTRSLLSSSDGADERSTDVDGCPYPPGCGLEEETEP